MKQRLFFITVKIYTINYLEVSMKKLITIKDKKATFQLKTLKVSTGLKAGGKFDGFRCSDCDYLGGSDRTACRSERC